MGLTEQQIPPDARDPRMARLVTEGRLLVACIRRMLSEGEDDAGESAEVSGGSDERSPS